MKEGYQLEPKSKAKRTRKKNTPTINIVCTTSEGLSVKKIQEIINASKDKALAPDTLFDQPPCFTMDIDLSRKCQTQNLDQCYNTLKKDGEPGKHYAFIRVRCNGKSVSEITIKQLSID
jgi:hypothetical protein